MALLADMKTAHREWHCLKTFPYFEMLPPLGHLEVPSPARHRPPLVWAGDGHHQIRPGAAMLIKAAMTGFFASAASACYIRLNDHLADPLISETITAVIVLPVISLFREILTE